jgi:hypothetical protein
MKRPIVIVLLPVLVVGLANCRGDGSSSGETAPASSNEQISAEGSFYLLNRQDVERFISLKPVWVDYNTSGSSFDKFLAENPEHTTAIERAGLTPERYLQIAEQVGVGLLLYEYEKIGQDGDALARAQGYDPENLRFMADYADEIRAWQ